MNAASFHLVIVGAGNIGSALAPLVGRMASVGRITVIDHDIYDAGNLVSQAIAPSDVGAAKATVQARRLREMNPALRVEAIVQRVENVPLGKLRADALCGCVDSREARRTIAEAAMRLGVFYIDAGVMADGWLVRTSVYGIGPESACLQCAWSEGDYALLEQAHPCAGGAQATFPTNAPAFLGALAASLQAAEVLRLLEGDTSGAGRQQILDARSQRHFVSRLERNAACRFDHAAWAIEPLGRSADEVTLRDAIALGAVRVAGQSFLTELACPKCAHHAPIFRLRGRLAPAELACARCAGAMLPVGYAIFERLEAVPAEFLSTTLRAAGADDGDLLLACHTAPFRCVEIGNTPTP